MSKYDMASYKNPEGERKYFVYEIERTTSVGGFGMNICNTIFYGTEEECKIKLEELRKEEANK